MARSPSARARTFAAFIALAAVPGLSAIAAAQEQSPSAASDSLAAERARLRADLDKVNAEIDALKRASSLRDDYRLRARLADAEALARRLREIDARLGIRDDASRPTARPAPTPTAVPTDGPADLDAKADILADQARRLRVQAESLGRRAQDLKGRLDLRRRVADLDRDPFAPMEGSKRRVATAAGTTTNAERTGNGSSFTGSNQAPTTVPQPPPMGGAAADGASRPPAVNIAGGNSLSGPPPPTPTASGVSPFATPSIQLRDLLDTSTLADIRRLERAGTPSGSIQALERAAAALQARAADLDARSRAMRPKPAPNK
jgi:uncharacterized protein YhaN